jgi:hypothetical protein
VLVEVPEEVCESARHQLVILPATNDLGEEEGAVARRQRGQHDVLQVLFNRVLVRLVQLRRIAVRRLLNAHLVHRLVDVGELVVRDLVLRVVLNDARQAVDAVRSSWFRFVSLLVSMTGLRERRLCLLCVCVYAVRV